MSRIVTLDNLVLEHPLWKNPRTITALGAKDIEELGEDLLARGQKDTLLVQQIKNEDGSITELVLDGQRRVLAFRRACKNRKKGESTVEVKVDDYFATPIELTTESSDKMLLDVLAMGAHRAGISSFEQVEAARQIMTRHPEWNMKQVGEAIKRSETWVSRMVRARKLAEDDLVKAWSSGKLTDEQFKDLASLPRATAEGENKQKEALKEALDLRSRGAEGKAEARHKIKAAADKEREKAKANKKPSKKAKKAKAKTNGHNKRMITMPTELTAMGRERPPTDPYVKGLMHGAGYALGEVKVDDFAPAFRTYVERYMKAGNLPREEFLTE